MNPPAELERRNPAAGANRQTEDLRLITINTWKCDGAYQKRVEIMIAQLRELKPDVVCCQEVFQSADRVSDTGRMLAKRLNMTLCYVPARKKMRPFKNRSILGCSGLAILSRWRVVSSNAVFLTTHDLDHDRRAQFVVLSSGSCRALIINTHLTHLPQATHIRKLQIAAILAHPWLWRKYQAVLLCGDFNAQPAAPEMVDLCNSRDLSAMDLGPRQDNGRHVPTYPSHGEPAGQAHKLKCLDYIFSLCRQGQFHPQVRRAQIALDQPSAEGFFASDHKAVLVDLRIQLEKDRPHGR